MRSLLVDPEVASRVERLGLPFNRFGIDPYGVSRKALIRAFSMSRWFYRKYFAVKVYGIDHVPDQGRAMLVGNHAGGVALDAWAVIASMFFDKEPPRLAQSMVEKFVNRSPILSQGAARTGQIVGLPQNAERLLQDDRMLLVFPEGARGTAKLFAERYSLVDFGTGFLRLALQTQTPIIPFALIGGGEAFPTVRNAYKLGQRLGAPYVPITPYLFPVPLPVPLAAHFGIPMRFSGTGREEDDVIHKWVGEVKSEIAQLIEGGLGVRRDRVAQTEKQR